jgi:TolB-like protein
MTLDTKVFEFAGHSLDVARSTLQAADREIELRPKSLEVLRYLVENSDRLVTKDELVKAVWPNSVVTDESLTHCISEVRQAIGDAEQTIIKTVPRRGYRLVAPVARLPTSRPPSAELPPAAVPAATAAEAAGLSGPPLPERPSVAVLPFQNMSDDPGQEHLADGMVEEIITALSRFSSLFVIARNSSFTYKGRAVDVKQVGRELGVRYVLEGSVRRAANRVRITGQLIDAATGAHLWADRFDGALDDVFDMQDNVTTSVVSAIAPRLEQVEIVRARRKPTESLDAYDYFLRGMEQSYQNTRGSIEEALHLFARAAELDPGFAAAYGTAAYCYAARKANRWMTDPVIEIAEASRLGRKAVQLGRDDAVALSRAGHALAYVVEELDAGAFFIGRAFALNPNLAQIWFSSSWLRVWIGEPDVAIKHFAQFKRMSPLDPKMPDAQSACAFAHFFCGNYDEAALQAEQALQEDPTLHSALRVSAAANALVGRMAQARNMVDRLRRIDPTLRVAILRFVAPKIGIGISKEWVKPGCLNKVSARHARKAGFPKDW